MASTATVGVLRALLTADTAQFDTGMKKASGAVQGLGREISKLTPQAERMAKTLGGDKLLATANNLVAAITKVGGATKLTEAEQKRANDTLTVAIAKYRALGLEAPKDMLALANATRQATTSTGALATTFATLTASFTIANLITRATGALIGMANAALATAGNLVDMSGKTGLSTETLQRMGFVADQVGATLDDFTTASFRLGVTIASGSKVARAAFDDLAKSSDALGVSFEQFQRLTPDEQFARITAALHDVDDQQERNRIGVALMGKSYATIAAAVAENFNEMAKAATVSSAEQIKAIDDAVDAWTRFVASQTTNVQAFLGNTILFVTAMKQAVNELGVTASGVAVFQRAQEILALRLLNARTKDIELTVQQAAVQQSYRAQLAVIEAELAGLTSTQLAEIAAAQKVGVTDAELEKQFHLSEGALKLLNTTTKDRLSLLREQQAETAKLFKAQTDAANKMADIVDATEDTILKQHRVWDKKEEDRAERTAAAQLKTFVELNESLISLDAERTRKLLVMNSPGAPEGANQSGKLGKQMGESIGAQMQDRIGDALEDVPNFLIRSVLHSGSFLNGLKAIGLQMADAIAEPLIRQLGRRIANMFITSTAERVAAKVGSKIPFIAPLIPGVGGANPPDPNKAPQPQNPTPPPTGIVPLPTTPPGGGGHVPTPPPISKTSIPDFGRLIPTMEPVMSANGGALTININTIDAAGVRDFVNSDNFTHSIGQVFRHNRNFLTTTLRGALD